MVEGWRLERLMSFPFQKQITTAGAVVAVAGGATVGGNAVIDNVTGGPEKREVQRVEEIRELVKQEVYRQLYYQMPTQTTVTPQLKTNPNGNP